MGLKNLQRRTPGQSSWTIRADRLERLRGICLSHDASTEKIAWGDPTWRVNERIFAMQKGNYQGGRPSGWFKGDNGAQAMLVDSDSVRFFVPPYVGNKGWIGVYLDTESVDWDELAHLIGRSYEIIGRR